MYKIYISDKLNNKELLHLILKKNNIKENIMFNEYGKPYIKSHKIYFNLSDSGSFSVCAIADREVGVDIQIIKEKKFIKDRICNKHEKKLINNVDDLIKIWVKKEAYIKCIGLGIEYGLKNVDTTKMKNVYLKKINNYYIAVVLK